MNGLTLGPLCAEHIPAMVAAFAALGWGGKDTAQYTGYLAEQEAGSRDVLVALVDGAFVGYLTIVWESEYAPFAAESIPEIVDFNVLPPWRRQGIGGALMDAAEERTATRSPVVGIGVGMTADYGAAQRLYVRRGYLPDGRGLTTHGAFVTYGASVPVDDGLVLHFTKRLG